MPTDAPTPLATSAAFALTAFSDLSTNLQAGELDNVMLQATRACENACNRRLAPFTVVNESSRLDAGDLDDFGGSDLAMPAQAQMGMDYSRALGMGQMTRHMWVREYPPLLPELWTGAITSLNVYWPYQSTPYLIGPQALQYDIDTGHVRFLVGTFVPFGSVAYVSYTGGYATVPADLEAACLSMAASIIIKRLDPAYGTQHDPDLLRDEAIELLDPFMRD